MPTEKFVWTDTGSVRLMVHGRDAPTDEEWQRFLSETVRQVHGRHVFSDRRGALIYSCGGMATPRQRGQLSKIDFTSGRIPTLVLMTDSRFARGVATAVGWVVPKLRDFHALARGQVAEAANLLGLYGPERQEFERVLAELVARVEEAAHDQAAAG